MKRKTQITIIIALLIPALTWLFMPYYLKKAIIHQHPGIFDYQIFHNRTVANANPALWPKSANYNLAQMQSHFKDSLDLMQTTAFLVIQNDSLLFEYYADDFNDTQIVNSFSVSKSIVALLIGCALADGYLRNLNQPIEELLPTYRNLHGKGLKLHHLLTMSSGSNWDETYSSAFSITTKAYYGNNIPQLMRQVQIVDKPGETVNYRSGDTQLLALILAEATGKTLSEYFSERLWKPLSAENPGLWSLDRKNGTEKAYCCFTSHARDFARIGQLVLNDGQWDGQQLIPADYVKAMVNAATHLANKNGEPNNHYGFQWWIMRINNMQIPYARGILGQYIFVVPDKNAVVVRLGHQRSEQRINEHPVDAYTWIQAALNIIEQNN